MATLSEASSQVLQGEVVETGNLTVQEAQINESAAEPAAENESADLDDVGKNSPAVKQQRGDIISPDPSFITVPNTSWNGSSTAESINVSDFAAVCSACGIQANDQNDLGEWACCSVCSTERYCSPECRQWDWTSGGHGEVCQGVKVQIEHGPLGPPDPGEMPVVRSKEAIVRELLTIAGSTPSVTSFTSDLSSQPSTDSGSSYILYRSSLVTRWKTIDESLQRSDNVSSASEALSRLLPGVLDDISDSDESYTQGEDIRAQDDEEGSDAGPLTPCESSSIVTESDHSITDLLAARLGRNLSGKESLNINDDSFEINIEDIDRFSEAAFGVEKDYDLMDYDISSRNLDIQKALKQENKSGELYDIIFVPSDDSSTCTEHSLKASSSIASDGIVIPPFAQLIMNGNELYGIDMETGFVDRSNEMITQELVPEQKMTGPTPEVKNRRTSLNVFLLIMAGAIITLAVFFGVYFSSTNKGSQTASEESQANQTTKAPHNLPQVTALPTQSPAKSTSPPISLEPSTSPSGVASTPVPSLRPSTASLSQIPSTKPSLESTSSPTQAPSGPPTFPAGVQQLFEDLAPRTFDNGTSILTDGTPQNQAFLWLSNSSGIDNSSTTKLAQRYALATFYFSTNGDSWRYNNRWLSDADECLWFTHSRDSPCDQSGWFQTLQFFANDLSGKLPDELAMLRNLTTVALIGGSTRYISGTLPRYFGNLANLEVLKLKGNIMNGTIPLEFGRLSELTVLDLSDNKFSGQLPSSLENLSKLTSLDVSANRLTGEMPRGLLAIQSMLEFSVAGNRLSGAIPTSVSGMAQIEKLSLESNKFDALPSQIGKLTTLNQLTIFENRINGTLPSEIGALSNMEFISLHTNDFYGRLPTSLGLMTALELFEASSNSFSGPIPTEVGLMQALVKFRMSSNKLSGVVPTAFSLLPDLDTLLLDENDITGKVPFQVCSSLSSRYAYIFYTDCGSPNKEVNCTCCTQCCSDGSGCKIV